MATNDLRSVAAVLAQDFVLEWSQTNERIRGSERFSRMNHEYPAVLGGSVSIGSLVANQRRSPT